MPDVAALRPVLEAELDRCSPSRDHPLIAALADGRATRAQLHELARQQWVFHRRFPSILTTLAGHCGPGDLAAHLAAEAESQAGRHGPSRADRWAPIAAALGVDEAALAAAEALPTTETMLLTQAAVAALPHPTGYVALQVGVNGESLPHMQTRRSALVGRYGVPAALVDGYFGSFPGGAVLDGLLAPVAERDADEAAVVDALRSILRVRWGYFDGIVEAAP